jgi:hypothetical protein
MPHGLVGKSLLTLRERHGSSDRCHIKRLVRLYLTSLAHCDSQ